MGDPTRRETIENNHRRRRRRAGHDPPLVISGFLIVVRIRRAHNTSGRAFASSCTVSHVGLAAKRYSISRRHVRTILHFPATPGLARDHPSGPNGLRLNISSSPEEFPLLPSSPSPHARRGSLRIFLSRSLSLLLPAYLCREVPRSRRDRRTIAGIFIFDCTMKGQREGHTRVTAGYVVHVVSCRRPRSRKCSAVAVADCTIMQRDGYLRITI